MTHDKPTLGIFLMLLFCVFAPLGDAYAKILGGTVPLAELVFLRFLIQTITLVPLAFATQRPMRMSGRVLYFAWLRVVLHIAGIAAMFAALQYLPLADAVAIAFVMPFILLILGHFLLNENVGAYRLIACIVGFAGTLLVIQPSFEQVGFPALLPLVVAFVFSGFILTTRQISRDTDPIGLQAVNGVMAIIIVGPILFFASKSDLAVFQIIVPAPTQIITILTWGAIGTVAHLLMTWSLRFAPSATVAPMQYLEIPVATFFGWLIFGDLPNTMAACGIVITIAAGLYIIWREQANAAHARLQGSQTQPSHAAE
jgi:drug/metabolite transporter (DMT)-like permease